MTNPRFVMQRIKHEPENGHWGDCHRAAIATALGLPYEDVPHFMDGGVGGGEGLRREREWLKSRGLVPITLPYDCELGAVLECQAVLNPGTFYLIGGTSALGVGHTVVGFNGEIVHDPSPKKTGIVRPMEDGFYWVTFFGTARATLEMP